MKPKILLMTLLISLLIVMTLTIMTYFSEISETSNQNQPRTTDTENKVVKFLMTRRELAFAPDESVPIPLMDLNEIGGSLYLYRQKFNEYPQGSHAQMMQTLDKEYFLSAYGVGKLNDQHEYLDRWGTRYEIHLSPFGELRLISAGPNKLLVDEDDEVLERHLQKSR